MKSTCDVAGGNKRVMKCPKYPKKKEKYSLSVYTMTVCEGPTLDKCVLIFLKEITSNSFDGLAGLV